jgi:hypothetical protein
LKINKFSKKMVKLNSEYSKLRKIHLDTYPMCQAKIYNCHRWIEEHPKEAIELNLSQSKF